MWLKQPKFIFGREKKKNKMLVTRGHYKLGLKGYILDLLTHSHAVTPFEAPGKQAF